MRAGPLLAAACALTQTGCLAYYISGAKEPSRTETAGVTLVEDDARLRCNSAPCDAVPFSRTVEHAHDSGSFLTVLGVEAAAAVALKFTGGKDIPVVGGGSGNTLFFLAALATLCDLVTGAYQWSNGKFDTHTAPWTLGARTQARWRGLRVPLRAAELLPNPALPPLARFSLAKYFEDRGLPLPDPVPVDDGRPGRALQDGLVVVLGFDNGARPEVSDDNARALNDAVGKVVLDAGGPLKRLQVMMPENQAKLLAKKGKTLEQIRDSTPADSAHDLEADAYVTGALERANGRYLVRLRLFLSEGDKRIAESDEAALSLEDLTQAAQRAAGKLVEPLR